MSPRWPNFVGNPVLLALGCAVLLVHLGLLQSMPVGLSAQAPGRDPALTFVTRGIALPEVSVRDSARRTTARTSPAKKSPQPAAQSQTAPESVPQPVGETEVSPGATKPLDASAPSGDAVASLSPPSDPSTDQKSIPPENTASASAAPVPEASTSTPGAAAAEALVFAAPPEPAPLRHPRAKLAPFQVGALSGSSQLRYEVHASKFPISLKGELIWRNLGDRYEARLGYSAFGLSRSQISQGRITVDGLLPERFADKYRTELAAHFNYSQHKLTFSANTPDAELLSGAQDRLSVLVQLGALVAGEPARFAPGTTLSIQTVGVREADVWLFTFESTETLNLPGGTLQGLKLVRLPRKPYDQKVEVWLAEHLGYLPARIRITDANGDSVDQQWLASTPLQPP